MAATAGDEAGHEVWTRVATVCVLGPLRLVWLSDHDILACRLAPQPPHGMGSASVQARPHRNNDSHADFGPL